MKKLLSLILVLCLCLSAAPVLAEETAAEAAALPNINAPITVEAYQAAYNQLMAYIVPDSKISWASIETDEGQIVWTATLDGSFTAVLVLEENGMASELATMLQAELTEDSLTAFLSIAGYAGAALMLDADTTEDEACEAFITELYTVFTAMLNGEEPENLCGLPCGISIAASETTEGAYELYFVLQLPLE